ncbi:nucleoside-diphosphate-sugar epimerase [Murinocardiopsis flavida]|uniref:Nucleoside-diphosphate-sugar epimerase n=1 Tax=Murinocardiopsis flavida TaxID=645275 RepID=A0A2P8DDU5_9ACTN|nr:NAD-dependent epimerase/dehydratase family protein [Murinocardiopsis flavida]PSK95404.1 nucleoside-diphosphate-sugar epimerase [Murinocardiopsis flavida]
MRLLILGGTEFVGRAAADEALSRGWDVTLFNRGNHAPPQGATVLAGDRTGTGGLAALGSGEWDVVVDTWSGAPSAVRATARLLADRAGSYAYVSSRSVYASPAAAGMAEDGPVVDAEPGDGGGVEYARAKRGGELAAAESFGDRALLARPGLIIGPRENIGRLPWWLLRIARGGPVLAPGPSDLDLQYIDARDFAAWTIDAAARGLGGAYNVVSPPGHTTMGELLAECVRATGSAADLRWSGPDRILAAGIRPWLDLPIWLAPGDDYDLLHQGDTAKAHADGLRCRPVAETVADTWAWLQGLDGAPPQRADRPVVGLDPDVEARFLRA